MKLSLCIAGIAVILGGCDQEAKPVTGPAPTSAGTPAPEAQASFQDIMLSVIDPAADGIWSSLGVSYDTDGEHRLQPTTEKEWLALRRHAVALTEGPNLIAMGGRSLVSPGATIEFEKYYPAPAEIQGRLDANRPVFLQMAQSLQQAAMEATTAIDKRDAAALDRAGERIDEACEACHKTFWYTEAR